MEIYIGIIAILIVVIFVLFIKVRNLSSKIENFQQERSDEVYPQLISSENFESILKSITDGILILDPKGNILFANRSFKELLKTEESPEGKQFMEIIRNLDLLELLRYAMEEGREVSNELSIKKGGEEIFIIAKAMPVIAPGGSVNFLIILLHDITRLKKLENIRKEFVTNVSHELKTPVTAIKGYAEALFDGAIDDKENAKKFVGIIKSQADRLVALIDDILTLSKIESGATKLEKEAISLEPLVLSVFQTFAEKAQKKGISLQSEIPSGISIKADRNKLTQILINLIDNGIKFTDNGRVKVKLQKEDKLAILSVEDTGIGISKEHLPRIGERFYRVDRARSRDTGGTGLGLAIVKHLVRIHGWDLKIESEIGKGTKVKIIISEQDIIEA